MNECGFPRIAKQAGQCNGRIVGKQVGGQAGINESKIGSNTNCAWPG